MERFSLKNITKSLCNAIKIESPIYARESIGVLDEFVLKKTCGEGVDRIVVFNPDAVGEWIAEKYKNILADIWSCDLKVKMKSVVPPKTPVCFGTIYTGATPQEHGIQHYEKRKIEIDSFFDALARANKKGCIVTVANQSMDILFRDRAIDYYCLNNDKEVVQKAVQLINEKNYDIICVYNQEYDDIMHRTHPKSLLAKRALKHYNQSYKLLLQAIKQSYVNEKTLFATITDHGVHREWYLLGNHGKDIDKDMNITHFYNIIEN